MKSAIVKDHYKAIIVSKYGCENVFQSEVIKQKSCETCLRNHGVEYPSQNIEIFKKQQITMKKFKPSTVPSGKIIHLKGYEPQFLDFAFSNSLLNEDEIEYEALAIKYIY